MIVCLIAVIASGCGREQEKRYHCKDARFSIIFPEDWKIRENVKGTRILAEIPDDEGIAVIRQNVNVVVEEVGRPVALIEYIEQQKNGLQKLRGVKILTTGETVINGVAAKWLTYTYTIHDFGYQALVYVLNKNTEYYVITGLCQVNTFPRHEARLHAIAKSFRFE